MKSLLPLFFSSPIPCHLRVASWVSYTDFLVCLLVTIKAKIESDSPPLFSQKEI